MLTGEVFIKTIIEMKKPLYTFFKILFKCSLITIMSLFILEIMIRLLAANETSGDKTYKNPYARCKTENAHFSQYVPHPHFGFVRNPNHPCQQPPWTQINAQGFENPEDFPHERNEAFFDILIVGGSVAGHMAIGWDKLDRSANEIELLLNQAINSGRRFRVFNGATNGSSVPYQQNVILAHAHAFDGVIVIDGYNDLLHSKHNLMGLPDMPYYIEAFLDVDNQIHNSFLYRTHLFLSQSSWLQRLKLVKWIESLLLNWSINRQVQTNKSKAPALYSSLNKKPKHWSQEDLLRHNRKHYARLTLMGQKSTEIMGAKFHHFFQPMPEIGKVLTKEEKSHTQYAEADAYLKMWKQLKTTGHKNGLKTESLLYVFKDESETIYGDHVHAKIEADGKSRGYRLIAEAIVKTLVRAWDLRQD